LAGIFWHSLRLTEDARRATDRSLALREGLVREAPDNVNYRCALAQSYRAKADRSTTLVEREKYHCESLAILETLHKDYPSVKKYQVDWASARLALAGLRKDLNGQKDAYDQLDQLRALNSYQYKRLGAVHFQLKLYDKALADIAKAVELRPDDDSNLLWIDPASVGRCPDERFRNGMLALADKSIEVTRGKDADAFRTRAILNRGMGHHDKVIADLEKAAELRPTAPRHLNFLAWILATSPDAKSRDPRRAVEVAQKAMHLQPANGNHCNTLGVAQYRAGDWNASIKTLEKSMQLGTGAGSFGWFFLSMAHWRLGQKDEASKWYQKSVEWMDKKMPRDEELIRFRAEAEALLGVKK
jgi:tetratricopeptide (TPR) repeat protein